MNSVNNGRLGIRRTTIISLASLLVLVFVAVLAIGQATMPDGWQDLPPDQLITEFDAMMAQTPGPTDAYLSEVADVMYNTVTAQDFVTTADGDVLMQLVDRLSGPLAAWYTTPRKTAVTALLDARLATDPALLVTASFDDVTNTRWDAALRAGVSRSYVADAAAKWMDEQDWQSLAPEDLPGLIQYLEDDAIDRTQYSVRWSGNVSAPASGAYVFGRNLRGGQVRIVLNGEVVLDSGDKLDGDDPQDVDISQVSQPIDLVSGQSYPITVEFVYERDQAKQPVPERIESLFQDWAHLVVTWQLPNQTWSEVPPEVLSQPDSAGSGGAGLKAEYFQGVDFTQLVQGQVDSQPQLVSYWSAPTTHHVAKQRQLAQTVVDDLTDPTFLAQANTSALFWTTMQMSSHLSATQARQLLGALASHPDSMTDTASTTQWYQRQTLGIVHEHLDDVDSDGRPLGVSPYALWWLDRSYQYARLPGADSALDTIQAQWCQLDPEVSTKMGPFPGWASGEYDRNNYGGYWHLAYDNVSDQRIEALRNVLTNGNGTCNQRAARLLTFAFRQRGDFDRWKAILDEELDKPNRAGDEKVSWLLARGFAQEVRGAGRTLLGPSLMWLNEALGEASSEEVRLQVVGELAVRYAGLDREAQASALLDSVANQFSIPEAQQRFAEWRQGAAAVTQAYVAKRETNAAEAHASYVSVLEQRMQRASNRGDSTAVTRYQQLISNAQGQ